ncbi:MULTISPECIES: hypothetical protein [Nitrosomonas]|nr:MULTISPECIES: hypothetical protein [Nitrosomonas]UVS61386.1 hypothetical protein NX761_18260 [Nitrosomonas sp. PLL12]
MTRRRAADYMNKRQGEADKASFDGKMESLLFVVIDILFSWKFCW